MPIAKHKRKHAHKKTETNPKGAGRPPGSLSKTSLEVREMAREYGPLAIQTLAALMLSSRVKANVRVAAADSLLDRGYGKAVQMLANDPDNPLPSMPSRIMLIAGQGTDDDELEHQRLLDEQEDAVVLHVPAKK